MSNERDVSNQDHGPGMWSTEPLGGKGSPEEDVSPGAQAAIGGDPFGLSGRGAVEPDAPHKDPTPHGASTPGATTHSRDVLAEGEQHPNSSRTIETPESGDTSADFGADRQGYSGPGNPGSVANSGSI